jgi:dipeptidyl aminopeptidase/acylaminoacyl peptidase
MTAGRAFSAASFAVLVFALTATAQVPKRPYEVRDSIEMSEFVERAVFSPDGRWFASVTQRGLLPQGVTEATIWLFDAAEVKRAISRGGAAPVPTPLTRLSAAINGGHSDGFGRIILNLRWSADSMSLTYLGRDGRENRQLFRVGLKDRKVAALTPANQDVVDYAFAGNEGAYLAGPDIIEDKLWSSTDPHAPDIVAGTGQPIDELLYPNSRLNHRFMPMEFEIWRIRSGPEPVVDAGSGKPMRVVGSYYAGALALSPDGTRLAVIAHADRIPPAWQTYESPGGLEGVAFAADPQPADTPVPLAARLNDYTRARQYEVIDLAKGARAHLVEAPVMDFLRGGEDEFHAAWSPDGQSIAVSQTFLPPDHGPRATGWRRACAVAVVSAGAASCLTEPRREDEPKVAGVGWEPTGKRVIVQFTDASTIAYERRAGRWSSAGRRQNPLPLDLTIRQALNVPPALFARDRAGKELKLFDPNPQLNEIALGEVANYFWKGPRGQDAWGGLVKPPDFSPSRRYPLVIQTHGHNGDDFFSVGYSNTTNAGRALAARGMLVLQVSEPHARSDGTWEEAQERATEVYLAAIDQLAREGLVDPKKVGVGGYSRRGLYVVKALEDAPDRFAAAVVGDSVPGSLFDYYMLVDFRDPQLARQFAEFNAGAPPYGDGLRKWLERSGGLRTDRIQAPVLVSAAFPTSLMVLWNLYAPLRDQRKPVELQYIRTGSHTFAKPLQVLAHQEMVVDWYDFWLNGHEDDDPAKADQYVRWRQMSPPATPAPAKSGCCAAPPR